MEERKWRALVTAYYLSRHDRLAYRNLGFATMSGAHEKLGTLFGLTADAIKNRRDEFDPIHGNGRVGWHQRDLRPSRAAIVDQFSSITESALRELIKSWMVGNGIKLPPLELVQDDDNANESWNGAGGRAITGAKAEQWYIDEFARLQIPVAGLLKDTRSHGCGYDFEILINDSPVAYVELKGLTGSSGTITMTAREWATAQELEDNYYLVIVKQVYSSPGYEVIRHPAANIVPTLRLTSIVQESWSFHSSTLNRSSAIGQ